MALLCLLPNPLILVFTPSARLPPTPLWHLSSSSSCTSPLHSLIFKNDTSHAEKMAALLVFAFISVIFLSSQVSPWSLTPGFYLTLRFRALEQREPHYAVSLHHLPGAPYRTILFFLPFVTKCGCVVRLFPCQTVLF